MKYLIAGFGSIGRRHFNNLLGRDENDILFLRSYQSTLDDAALGDYQVETDIESALAHRPDAVIIATPSALHLDLAIPAAEQGCHLLIEKPLSNTLKGVENLALAAEKSGSRILMGFQFRYHPNLIMIKKMIEDGRIGRPLHLRSHWGEYLPGWHPWEDYRKSYAARKDLGGGVLLTLCHNFDYLRWIFGEATVHSALLGYHSGLELDVEDSAEVSLVFEEGLLGSVHLNFTQQPGKHSLEVVGTEGSLAWDYYQNRIDLNSLDQDGSLVEECLTAKDFERSQLFVDEMDHFISVVQGKEEPRCSLEDGIKALEICIQARDLGSR